MNINALNLHNTELNDNTIPYLNQAMASAAVNL